MGVLPYSQLQIAINPKLRQQSRYRNVAEIARVLRVSRYQVEKLLWHHNPDNPSRPVGRPPKDLTLTAEHYEWWLSKPSLTHSVGMPLKARLAEFNRLFGMDMKMHNARSIYKINNITNQLIRPRCGRPKLKHADVQHMEMQLVKDEVRRHLDDGYEVVQMDECLFQCDSKRGRAWAPAGHPIQTRSKWSNKQVVVVCGAISAHRGRFHMKYGIRSFNAMDMVEMYKEMRNINSPNGKLAIFLDNASIHKAKVCKDQCKKDKLNMPLIFNRAYRPDVMGIEYAWTDVKRRYRNRINWHKANGVDFDHMSLVKQVIDATHTNIWKNAARRGWRRLERALPIKPLWWEVPADKNWVEAGDVAGKLVRADMDHQQAADEEEDD